MGIAKRHQNTVSSDNISLVRNKPNGTVECLVQEVPHFLIEEFIYNNVILLYPWR